MAKQSWQDRGTQGASGDSKPKKATTPKAKSGSKAGGWNSKKNGSPSRISTRKILLASLFIGGCVAIAAFVWSLRSPKKTPLVIITSGKVDDGPLLFRSDPFRNETLSWFDREGDKSDLSLFESKDSDRRFDLLDTLSADDFSNRVLPNFGPGGPNKDVRLVYLYSNGIVDNNTPYLLTKNSDLNRPDSWLPFADVVKRLGSSYATQKDKVVVFLDCGRGSVQLDREMPFNDFPSKAGKLVTEMIANGTIGENFRLVVSNSDHQKGWTSSELNSSVFGFFVSNGLRGWADIDGDKEVSFAEMISYLSSHVRDWAQDYRDSDQNVCVFPTQENVSDFPLVYASNRSPPVQSNPENLKRNIDELWHQLSKHRKKLIHYFPLVLSRLEARLIRLEELQNEPAANPEYLQIFNQVKKELASLINDKLSTISRNGELISLAESNLKNDLSTLANDVTILQRILRRPSPGSPKPTASTDEPGNDTGTKRAETKTALEKKSSDSITKSQPNPTDEKLVKEESEFLSKSRMEISNTVWHFFLKSDEYVTQNNIEACLALLEQKNNSRNVEWVEIQFLRLLLENVDWQAPKLEKVTRGTVWEAIKCRHLSEQLVQQFSFPETVASWPFVDGDLEKLEAERRHCEDLLLAGAFQESFDAYKKRILDGANDLKSGYEVLQDRSLEISTARELAMESLWAIPHVMNFLVKENFMRVNGDHFRYAAKLQTLYQDSNQAFDALLGSKNSFDFKNYNVKTRNEFAEFKAYLASYGKLDKPNFSESETLRIQQHLLESPLIEWIKTAPSFHSQAWTRASIRQGIDDAYSRQATSFFASRYWDPESKNVSNPKSSERNRAREYGLPPIKPSLHVEDRLNGTDFLKLKELLTKAINWSREDASKFETILDSLQTTRPEKGTENGSSIRRDQLLQIDLLNRHVNGRSIYSEAMDSRDIGIRLGLLHTYNWNTNRITRSLKDFWGDGLVGRYDNAQKRPPYLKYADAYRLTHSDLMPMDQAWLPDRPIQSDLASNELSKLNFDLGEFTTGRSGKVAIPYLAENTSIELKATIVGVEKLATISGDPNPVASLALLEKRQAVNSPLTIGKKSPAISRIHAMSMKDLGSDIPLSFGIDVGASQTMTSERELQFAFRGHQINSIIELQKQVVAPRIKTSYSTTLNLPKNKKSTVSVFGNEKEISDVMMILDCSASMNSKGMAGIVEGGNAQRNSRLSNAKLALKELLADLRKTGRFRVGFMAFAHRSTFLDEREAGKVLYSGPVHPFFDSEILIPITAFQGETTAKGYRQIENKIDDIGLGKGNTPLFYSILNAAEKLNAVDNENPKQLVVLTDGVNFQGVGAYSPLGQREVTIDGSKGGENFSTIWNEKYKNIKLHFVLMNPSNLPFSRYLTSKLANLKKDEVKNRSSIQFTEEIELVRYPKLLKWVNENEKISLVEAKDGDINDVKKKLLEAIRFVKFSAGLESESSWEKKSLGEAIEITITNPNSIIGIKMHDSIKPSEKKLALTGGEKIDLNFSRIGELQFHEYEGEFIDPKTVEIGSINHKALRLPAEMAFGIQATDHSLTGTTKPALIWAEVFPHTRTGNSKNHCLFDVRFKPDQRIPIVEFPKLTELNRLIDWPTGAKYADVRLWISQQPISPGAGTDITLGKSYTNINGFECSSTLESKILTVTVTSSKSTQNTMAEIENDHVITCDHSNAVKRTYEYSNGRLTKVIHQFSLDNVAAAKISKIKLFARSNDEALNASLKAFKTGTAKDPFFGTKATWINFSEVPLRE